MKRNSQQGMTTIGWIIIIAIFGSIVLTAFKVIPFYLEFFQIRSVLETVAEDRSIDPKSKRDLWTAINKRLLINQSNSLKRENIAFSRKDGVTTMTIDYRVEKPYIAQLFIGAHFVHSQEINR